MFPVLISAFLCLGPARPSLPAQACRFLSLLFSACPCQALYTACPSMSLLVSAFLCLSLPGPKYPACPCRHVPACLCFSLPVPARSYIPCLSRHVPACLCFFLPVPLPPAGPLHVLFIENVIKTSPAVSMIRVPCFP
jgi:hypothetical protein